MQTTIKNKVTGALTPMEKKQWDSVKDNAMWKDVFEEVTPDPLPQEPPEVSELKAKQAEKPPAGNKKAAKKKDPETK